MYRPCLYNKFVLFCVRGKSFKTEVFVYSFSLKKLKKKKIFDRAHTRGKKLVEYKYIFQKLCKFHTNRKKFSYIKILLTDKNTKM